MRKMIITGFAALVLAGAAQGQDGRSDELECASSADGDRCSDGYRGEEEEVSSDEDIMIDETERLDTISVAGLRPLVDGDLTSSVTVLDTALLGVRDTPFVADQLRAVPGVGVSRSGSAGALTQVRIRGGEANHTLVLLNGIEVSDPVTGETDFGLFSGAQAERIEVARGEQSTFYGSDAIGGVINIVTAPEMGARGLVEFGSHDTLRFDAGYGWASEASDLSIALSNVSSGGVDTSGLGGEADGYESASVVATGGHGLDNGWTLQGLARLAASEVDTDPDADFDGRLENANRVTQAEQWTLGGVVSGDAFGLNHLMRASLGEVTRDNLADGSLADTASGQRTKLAYSPSFDFQRANGDVTLSGLIDYDREDYSVRDQQFGGLTDQDEAFETLGLAGEVRAGFEAVSFNASLRQDFNDGRFDDATTWRVGAAYSFHFDGKLRASAGTGVKNPTFTELFGFFPGSFIGNRDLTPERSTSWEIGWDQVYGNFSGSVTYFEAELEDEIFTAFNPDFTATARNRAGDSSRSGLEAALAWQVCESISVSGSAATITSTNDAGADEIRVPEWTGSLALDWASTQIDGLRVGLALDHVGEQLDTDFAVFETVTLDAYTLVSASIDYPVTQRLSLTLRGENLLDERATDVFGYRGPGAGVFFGLRLR